MASRDRLRPLIRLILNQIVRTLTTTLDYKNGRAVPANRHPLLLMLDEFPMLGRLDVLAEALSLIAGYGIRACLVAQDLTQIYAAYGRDEAVTSQLRHDGRVRTQQDRDRTGALEAGGRDHGASCPPHLFKQRHERIGAGGGTVADDPRRGQAARRRRSADLYARASRNSGRAAAISQTGIVQATGRVRSAENHDRIVAEQPAALTDDPAVAQSDQAPAFLSYGTNREADVKKARKELV